MKTLLFLASIAAYGQVTINPAAINLDATGATAVRAWMLTQTKAATAKIAVAVAPGDTSITFDSGTGFAVGSVAIIGTEMLDITAKAGAVMTVTRAINGTIAGTYAVGVDIKEAKYKSFNNLGKQIVVDSLKQIVAQSATITGPVTTAQASGAATVEASVN